MLASFFSLAMLTPGRQTAFRRAAVVHLLVTGFLAWAVAPRTASLELLGHVLLVAGIVEGAVLIGWRLTQLPKSQALEFLLVSPLQPRRLFLAEAAVGVARLALVTFAGLPVLGVLVFTGRLELIDLPVLLAVPFTWGVVAGLGLTVWAYETLSVRRWGELFALGGVLFYLTVGVLAGENIRLWLATLPDWAAELFYDGFRGFHHFNPFGVLGYWLGPQQVPEVAWERLVAVEVVGLLLALLLLVRGAFRLKGHFHDRHYRPITDTRAAQTELIGERPLSWWAVRRVMEYSGRVNIWLAGGFGLLYAAYLVAGDAWPPWMGRLVFRIFEAMGGAPVLATGLVVLAAVPAAFQYGLWDSSTQDRCRRLELLLLTPLTGKDYWHASAAAAWRRGRGYFLIALVLWAALWLSGRCSAAGVLAALGAGVILWGLSFALGFRAFSNGNQANGLGALLTLGLPLLAFAALRVATPAVAALVPPGGVYTAMAFAPDWRWLPGPLLAAGLTLWLAAAAQARCEERLRDWYDRNQGKKVMD